VTQVGKGRCIVAARDIAAGETVLSERPALLFVQPEFEASVCACCLRAVQGALLATSVTLLLTLPRLLR
jgi:hypothetical protein